MNLSSAVQMLRAMSRDITKYLSVDLTLSARGSARRKALSAKCTVNTQSVGKSYKEMFKQTTEELRLSANIRRAG